MCAVVKMLARNFVRSLVFKRYFCSGARPHVAVVGAGPAGFYATQHIVKAIPNVQVDIYERLPVPFGLVRFGVAPDHPEVKNCITTFTKTAANPRVNLIGNTSLGVDVSLEELRKNYHAVVLSYGAEEDRLLGVPGEDLENVLPAKDLVSLYNGVPGYQDLRVNLDTDTVAVIGIGNVALDVVRMLLTPLDVLRKTDATEAWLDQLSKSRVKRVVVIGRRGPLHVSFTIKELRDFVKLQETQTVINKQDLVGIQEILPTLARPRKRLTELLLKAGMDTHDAETSKNQWHLKLFRSPLEFLPHSESSKVNKIILGVNEINHSGDVVDTGDRESLEAGLVLRSIGYRSVQADQSLPFDLTKGVVPNCNGRVHGEDGLYVTGWLATGPRGVIIDTMNVAFRVGASVAEDLKKNDLEEKCGSDGIKYLTERKRTNWNDWEVIDKKEQERGQIKGKPREKICSVDAMLDLLG